MSKKNDLLSAVHLERRKLLQNPFFHRPLMEVRAKPLGCGISLPAENSKPDLPPKVQGAVDERA